MAKGQTLGRPRWWKEQGPNPWPPLKELAVEIDGQLPLIWGGVTPRWCRNGFPVKEGPVCETLTKAKPLVTRHLLPKPPLR